MGAVVISFPRRRPVESRMRVAIREVLSEFVAFERTHKRVAWGTTLVGLALGLLLRALG